MDILEKLNDNINPDIPIKNGTPLYLPQNSNMFVQENDRVPHSLYVKYWSHLSPANQERTANRYVKGRYGSWVNAKRFWLAHNWY